MTFVNVRVDGEKMDNMDKETKQDKSDHPEWKS